ncbi:MAG TPA: hypothetical protein PLL71_07755 [Agriterribacter sp.]|nr:hypothetical protein [Agriterribacter sp.]HRQ49389.1 hypothetical protein [Agriterribacter sp.]
MNERPKIKIEKSIIDKMIELSTFLLITGTAILLGFYYNQLPEKVEINFNFLPDGVFTAGELRGA